MFDKNQKKQNDSQKGTPPPSSLPTDESNNTSLSEPPNQVSEPVNEGDGPSGPAPTTESSSIPPATQSGQEPEQEPVTKEPQPQSQPEASSTPAPVPAAEPEPLAAEPTTIQSPTQIQAEKESQINTSSAQSEPEDIFAPPAQKQPPISELSSEGSTSQSATMTEPSIASKENIASSSDAIETPELAKKEIIQKAEEAGAPSKEKVYTMPGKFKKAKPKMSGGKSKVKILILGILILILLIGGGFAFYFWTKNYYKPTVPAIQKQEQQAVEDTNKQTTEGEEEGEEGEITEEEVILEEEVQEKIEPVISQEQTIKVEVKSESENLIASAEFYLPAGAIEPNFQINIDSTLVTDELKKQPLFKDSSYEIIGAFYKFSASTIPTLDEPEKQDKRLTAFQKTTILNVFYSEELITQEWENDLLLGYFKDNLWTPLPSSLDVENNILTIEFDILPSDTIAILVYKEKLVPKIEAFKIAPNVTSSTDSDSDGLTDVEEVVFSTEINNPDSDADGNPDGQEIIGLMHPLSSDDVKLATSGLINVYTNPTYSYSFFYPSSWLARAIPETNNQEVLVITNTGEFFSATVENNPERLSPTDWYIKQSPNVDKDLLYETIVDNEQAVWNPEHLTVYITKDDRIYILSYNVGTERESNFKTIFEMIINSFQFVVQPQGRPNGTLIKYFDMTEVYLIENGKKRAFQSGEIFERIGFKWEFVIEIPLSETYLDGDVITGRLNGALIKYPDSSGIYLIENGKKRAFQSGEIFEILGYKWENVIEISVDEVYPDGPIIESALKSTP